jgi:hypothetical protein
MFKRILTVALCFALVLGVSTLAFAKKAKTEKKASAEVTEETKPETVVHKMSEPKDSLKDKLGLAFTTGGTGSLRMWLTNSMGLDLLANIGLAASTNTSFGLGLGANLIFPMLEEGPVAVYMKPGLLINFNSTAGGSDIIFDFTGALEAEAFIVKNVVSVGGTLGMLIGIDVQSVAGNSNTIFNLGLGTSSVSSLFVRVYM